MTNGSKRWRFFVLINAWANGNIFRVKKSNISLMDIFLTHPVVTYWLTDSDTQILEMLSHLKSSFFEKNRISFHSALIGLKPSQGFSNPWDCRETTPHMNMFCGKKRPLLMNLGCYEDEDFQRKIFALKNFLSDSNLHKFSQQ